MLPQQQQQQQSPASREWIIQDKQTLRLSATDFHLPPLPDLIPIPALPWGDPEWIINDSPVTCKGNFFLSFFCCCS